MSNYRNPPRRDQRREEGDFGAFLAVIIIAAIMLCLV